MTVTFHWAQARMLSDAQEANLVTQIRVLTQTFIQKYVFLTMGVSRVQKVDVAPF